MTLTSALATFTTKKKHHHEHAIPRRRELPLPMRNKISRGHLGSRRDPDPPRKHPHHHHQTLKKRAASI